MQLNIAARPFLWDKVYPYNPGITEYVEVPGRGHSLTIDSDWREVCDTALAFVKRFV